MDILLVFVKGAFRAAQSTINKKASSYTVDFNQKLYFGVLFESAAAIFSFVYLFATGFYGFGVSTLFFSFLTGIGHTRVKKLFFIWMKMVVYRFGITLADARDGKQLFKGCFSDLRVGHRTEHPLRFGRTYAVNFFKRGVR